MILVSVWVYIHTCTGIYVYTICIDLHLSHGACLWQPPYLHHIIPQKRHSDAHETVIKTLAHRKKSGARNGKALLTRTLAQRTLNLYRNCHICIDVYPAIPEPLRHCTIEPLNPGFLGHPYLQINYITWCNGILYLHRHTHVYAVEATKLEYDHPPTPKPKRKEKHHKAS